MDNFIKKSIESAEILRFLLAYYLIITIVRLFR